jgi:hypothetical protein
MVSEITSAGHTAVQLNDLSAPQLAGIDILYLWNNDNSSWGTAGAFRADVSNAVSNGLQVVAFDNSVGTNNDIPLPNIWQGNVLPANNVTITTDGLNAFGTGFGGTVTQSSLDNAGSTINGFWNAIQLPPGATSLMHVAGNPSQVVGFNYPVGAGQVSYFAMPMSTLSSGTRPAWETFAINTLSGGLVCFASGTLIKTPNGQTLIEQLAPGDMVLTMDHGPQPIRWIGSSKRPAVGNMAPILIRKGALGNTRDLRVSPQHRMLLSGWQAEVLFGESEVLATAKSLVNDHSILREEGGEVEYFHMLFDSHEIVYAEGAPSESFHPGAEGWKALDMPTRNEILELFPQLANGNFDSYGPSARASLKYKEGSLLSHSMISQTQH